jgi:hypothetical protein
MLCQTHINYQYWQMPVRDSLPPVSTLSSRSTTVANGSAIHTRFTVENSLGAWPGDNRYNSLLGYDAPDPTLLAMDRYGQPRWVDIGSGGPMRIEFEAVPEHSWVVVEPSRGRVKGDGAEDVRVWISIDWSKAIGDTTHVDFTSSDGAHILVTIPLRYPRVPDNFRGAVEGDGYVVFEAAHGGAEPSTIGGIEYAWKEIPFYGRTHSGMAVFPVEDYRLPIGRGPCLVYDFWAFEKDEVEVILHLGPSNNWIVGQQHAFAISMDDQQPVEVKPIPKAAPGTLSADWEEIVSREIREVKVKVPMGKEGKHSLRIFGMTPGLVFERVMVDMGGIAIRGYSYLGPPESNIL